MNTQKRTKDVNLDELKQCVSQSKTLVEMYQKMGYKTFSNQLRKTINDNHIDISHLVMMSKDAWNVIVKALVELKDHHMNN